MKHAIIMDNKVKFLPFHAINEFMVDDYRQLVIQSVFGHINKISEEKQRKINALTKRFVRVQGFRNSALAPLPLKINGCIDAFKKSPEFVATLLEAWNEINSAHRERIYEFLVNKNWELLPIEADRSLLPGFMIEWPKESSFEVLIQEFREKFPDIVISDDDISLLTVWVSNRLPYEMVDNLFSAANE